MREKIEMLLKGATNLEKKEIESLLETPPSVSLGDFAFPCFKLSKKLKKDPSKISEEIMSKLKRRLPKNINVESKGPYLNFHIDKKFLLREVLKKSLKEDYGKKNLGRGKKFLIEFSQPNTHKAFHIGHVRGTSIGESIARIYEFLGYKVIRTNYSGDTGMHIAKWIWAYKKFHGKEKIKEDEKWIASIYVEAVKKLKEFPNGEEEVKEINRKIEDKTDKKINELWAKTRKASIKSWKKIYKELDAKFDKHYFESMLEKDGKEIAKSLLKNKIAKKDTAVYVDLEKFGLGKWVLLRSDGTALYSSKDLALAIRKEKDFGADFYLVEVGNEQRLHFMQLKATLKLMKFKKEKVYGFTTHGLVKFPDRRMSSRTGDNVFYSELYEKIFKIAKEGIIKRGLLDVDIEKNAHFISVAAIKYAILKQEPIKDFIFDPKKEIKFEGNTGPYLLYSYARASSIIRKIKYSPKFTLYYPNELEIKLIKKIDEFKDAVLKAKQKLAPNILANYSFELAKAFNEFYHECPVIGKKESGARLKIVESFRKTLGKSLHLLGIKVLEKM